MSESGRVLVELVEAQERALNTAEKLLLLKNEQITILEHEIKIRKRDNLVLCSIIVIFGILVTVVCLLCVYET
jgi:hypothetical protein